MNNNISDKIIGTGITYDDVLLLPGYSNFKRGAIDLSTQLTKKISLEIPLVSAPMDTVTESALAIALAEMGGIGIIHRNLSVEKQAQEVKKVKDMDLVVGAAIGAGSGSSERARALVTAGVDVIVVDSAHGYADYIIEIIKNLKKNYNGLQVIGGNVATYEGAKALIEAGVDALRVGMGPGAICTTRIISGMGVPQITAIFETSRAAKSTGVPIIADGGVQYSGDIVKALSAGANCVMMGNFFASCSEAPGEIIELTQEQVPSRFKSIFKKGKKSYKDRVLVAEGVQGLVPVHGPLKDIVDQALGGIRSGMYYVGAKNISELEKKGKFIQITQASLTESHPHDILITNGGENYFKL